MEFLDAHLHFFSPHWPGASDWPKKHGECLPSDYFRTSESAHGRMVIAVEASQDPLDDHNLRRIAEQTKAIAGFIANLQPMERGFAERLAVYSEYSKFKGLRLRPIESFDLQSDELLLALTPLRQRDLVLELGAKTTDRLSQIAEFVARLGDQRVVVNHAGHPRIQSQQIDPSWQRSMQALARYPHCFVKITPLRAFALNVAADLARKSCVAHGRFILDLFGPDRVLFGSNWPISASGGSPEKHACELADHMAFSAGDSASVFRKTAERLYRL